MKSCDCRLLLLSSLFQITFSTISFNSIYELLSLFLLHDQYGLSAYFHNNVNKFTVVTTVRWSNDISSMHSSRILKIQSKITVLSMCVFMPKFFTKFLIKSNQFLKRAFLYETCLTADNVKCWTIMWKCAILWNNISYFMNHIHLKHACYASNCKFCNQLSVVMSLR